MFTAPLLDDSAAHRKFQEELSAGNLVRMTLLLIFSTAVSLLGFVYNLWVTRDGPFAAWQIFDIAGSLIFLGFFYFSRRGFFTPRIRWLLGPAYFAFWLILMDGYYFNALPKYGETVTYALGVLAPAMLITLPPRWFLGLLIPNHVVFTLVLFVSERTIHHYSTESLLASFFNGTLGVIVAALGAWYRYQGTKGMFDKERVIAERNRETQLAESNVRAILENIPFEAWLKDASGVFRAVNHAYAAAKGLPEREIIGKSTHDLFSVRQAERYLAEDESILRTHQKMYFEERVWKDGVEKWYEIIKSPVIGHSGVCLGTVGLAREITARKEMEQQIVAANNAKSEFLATMSHEIRTPMNSVLGYAQLLRELPLTPIQREYVNSINNSGRLLLTIINDILDFSKIEAGKIVLQEEIIGLRDLFHRILSMFEPLAREKKLDLRMVLDPKLPRRGRLDPYRLEQVLVNLLSNALKFTDQGFVELRVSATPPDPANGDSHWQLQIEIQDSGIGIAPDQLDRLFKPFSQIETNVTRRLSGTGLGLVIVERLCAMMGGGIRVESEPAKGSTFRATLALTVMNEDPETPLSEIDPVIETTTLAGRSVLVVEDNATNRRLVATILSRWGIQAELAESGTEAIEKIRERDFEIVLMDVQMPGMDGLTATRVIRQWQDDHPARPRSVIIALTAFARADDSARCFDAGMDDYLSKPLNSAALKKKLGEYLLERKSGK